MTRLATVFVCLFVAALMAPPALAGDGIIVSSDEPVTSNYEFPEDLYEPGYFERKMRRQQEGRAVLRAETKAKADAIKANRVTQMQADQAMIDARVDAAVSQSPRYESRTENLKKAPPTTDDPQVLPGDGTDVTETPQINPGPGDDVTGGGTSGDIGTDTRGISENNDTRSVIEQMMDALR